MKPRQCLTMNFVATDVRRLILLLDAAKTELRAAIDRHEKAGGWIVDRT